MNLQKQMNELKELSFNGKIGISTFEERVKKYAETYHKLELEKNKCKFYFFENHIDSGKCENQCNECREHEKR